MLHQGGALALLRADGAEDAGRRGALVLRRHGPCAAPRPAAGDLVLLACAGLVGEPDFPRIEADFLVLRDACQRGGKVFLKAAMAPSAWAWCFGRADSLRSPMPRRVRLSVCGETETRNSSHSPWPRSTSRQRTTPWIAAGGTALDDLQQRRAVGVSQKRYRAGRLAITQPVRALGIEPHHPVTHDLQRHLAQSSRLAAAPIVDHRQGQQPSRLGRVLAAPRKATKTGTREVGTKRNGVGHGQPPMLAILNHTATASRNPRGQSLTTGFGITPNPDQDPHNRSNHVVDRGV